MIRLSERKTLDQFKARALRNQARQIGSPIGPLLIKSVAVSGKMLVRTAAKADGKE